MCLFENYKKFWLYFSDVSCTCLLCYVKTKCDVKPIFWLTQLLVIPCCQLCRCENLKFAYATVLSADMSTYVTYATVLSADMSTYVTYATVLSTDVNICHVCDCTVSRYVNMWHMRLYCQQMCHVCDCTVSRCQQMCQHVSCIMLKSPK
jgi:hypothetical protein